MSGPAQKIIRSEDSWVEVHETVGRKLLDQGFPLITDFIVLGEGTSYTRRAIFMQSGTPFREESSNRVSDGADKLGHEDLRPHYFTPLAPGVETIDQTDDRLLRELEQKVLDALQGFPLAFAPSNPQVLRTLRDEMVQVALSFREKGR